MFRYFVNDKSNNQFIIKDKDHHHIKNVIKLKPQEIIECVYNGDVFSCVIDEILPTSTIVKINYILTTNEKKVKKVLIMSLIREQKWDIAIQKATELGVDEIVPISLKRNIVKIIEQKEDSKVLRWQKICETAAMQAKRTTIPKVTNIIKNINELKNYLCDLNIVAWEEEKTKTLKETLTNQVSSISFLIGPEGGIEPKEIEQLKLLGFEPVSLGKNILRAETAPLYILSSFIYEGY
ncbi:16S rRNA (uracil(1498)-N(3))-methyltransferase [Spiroplasma endosymbiont of Crioceris asparagi]|uniref:RsmE family RNA methyltransferase n=1 Tax=Spiroplasma endosymbiont of Crioceris asparagi TaxID=3066286 RepID=UPI0030D39EBD